MHDLHHRLSFLSTDASGYGLRCSKCDASSLLCISFREKNLSNDKALAMGSGLERMIIQEAMHIDNAIKIASLFQGWTHTADMEENGHGSVSSRNCQALNFLFHLINDLAPQLAIVKLKFA